jgi:tetratricopeptide (TPR) repeat protein
MFRIYFLFIYSMGCLLAVDTPVPTPAPLPPPVHENYGTLRIDRNTLISIAAQVLARPDVQPANGETYCNQAAHLLLTQIGCDVTAISDKKGVALLANDMGTKLAEVSANPTSSGVTHLSEASASQLAKQGVVVVAVAQNPSGHGHIGVVIPTDGPDTLSQGPMIAQAGSKVGFRWAHKALSEDEPGGSFPAKLEPVKYYAVNLCTASTPTNAQPNRIAEELGKSALIGREAVIVHALDGSTAVAAPTPSAAPTPTVTPTITPNAIGTNTQKRSLESVVAEAAEKLRLPESKHHGDHHPPRGGEGGEAVKGVRIHFDEHILTEVLAQGTDEENSRLIDALTQRLAAAHSESARARVVTEFGNLFIQRYLALQKTCSLHDLTTISLKSLINQAEHYKNNWGKLPDDLRQPGKITRIHGFVIVGDDILLIGRREQGIPVLEIDDLIVGVQSVWKENAIPVVSLDPDPANIEGDPNVRIQGIANDSAFALTMLEADYAMKKIMAGVEPVNASGYLTLKDTLSRTSRTFMSRFWLYPVQPRVGDIRTSADNAAVIFNGVVRVLSEEMLNLKEGLVGTGQTFLPAEEAADSFTNCYEEIAAQKPMFKRLQTLFDVVLMARIWHVRGLQSPLLDRLCALPHRSVNIPRTYRAIKVVLRREGLTEYYLQGGVQAKVGAGRRNWLSLDDPNLGAIRQSCERASSAGQVSTPLAGLSLNAVVPSLRPDTSSRDYSNAVANLFRGDLESALTAVDRVLAYDGNDAEALILRALILLRSADYTQAQTVALKAREIDPSDRDTAAAAGQILFQCAWMQGNPERAIHEVEDSLKDDLQRASGQVSRGEALVLLDRLDDARQAYSKALELDPACALAYARLAQLELTQGRALAAKPWLQKAQALDANLPAVRVASAQWELVTVRPDLAEKIANEVWAKQESGPTTRLQALAILAAVSAAREKWNDVDKYVALMDELSAGSPEVLVAAADIALLWGERERASTYLAKATKLSPTHPLVLKMQKRLPQENH